MDKIIPFEKEIKFKTMISEITAISLDNDLEFNNNSNSINGNLIISGKYKMTEASQLEENFSYKLPVEVSIDDRYDIEESNIEIDDFHYEIINSDILKVNVDVLINNLVEKEDLISEKEFLKLQEEISKAEKEIVDVRNNIKEEMGIPNIEIKEEKKVEIPNDLVSIEKNEIDDKENSNKSVNSLFTNFNDEDDTFSTYKVYLVRENESIEYIMDKYQVTKEEIANYNNIDDIKPNTKVIIPCHEKD